MINCSVLPYQFQQCCAVMRCESLRATSCQHSATVCHPRPKYHNSRTPVAFLGRNYALFDLIRFPYDSVWIPSSAIYVRIRIRICINPISISHRTSGHWDGGAQERMLG